MLARCRMYLRIRLADDRALLNLPIAVAKFICVSVLRAHTCIRWQMHLKWARIRIRNRKWTNSRAVYQFLFFFAHFHNTAKIRISFKLDDFFFFSHLMLISHHYEIHFICILPSARHIDRRDINFNENKIKTEICGMSDSVRCSVKEKEA